MSESILVASRPLHNTNASHIEALSSARRFTRLDAYVLGSVLLHAACHAIAARLALGWPTAVATDILAGAYLIGGVCIRTWRPLLTRLLLFGLVAGVLEIGTDAAGEHVAHSLFYPPHEPMIWASPAYMPFSWMIVLTQLGYLAWRCSGLMPHWPAAALLGLWGALNIPYYEEMAYYAGWWHYASVRPIGHTPAYVLLFEGLVATSLPWLTRGLPRLRARSVALRGVILGAWMPCAAFLAWQALGLAPR